MENGWKEYEGWKNEGEEEVWCGVRMLCGMAEEANSWNSVSLYITTA